MKLVKFQAQVDETKCIGDGLCEDVCPGGAIEVIAENATVDKSSCVGCGNCSDRCAEEAISMVALEKPVLFGTNPDEVNQEELVMLCSKANLHPQQLICLCTATRVNEVAAAILKGADSIKAIIKMTGVCSGCTVYCTEPMLRLLKAHGIEPVIEKGRPFYNITQTLWDLPDITLKKHSDYYLKEDKDVFRKF